MLYLNSQKQTWARAGALQSAIRKEDKKKRRKKVKQNKIILCMNSRYNPVNLSQPYLNHIKTDTLRDNTITIIMKMY